MPSNELKSFLKTHPQMTNALFGSVFFTGFILPYGNNIGFAGP